MTGVAIDASSIYSDLKTRNLLQSVEHILWSQNCAERKKDWKMVYRNFILFTEKYVFQCLMEITF